MKNYSCMQLFLNDLNYKNNQNLHQWSGCLLKGEKKGIRINYNIFSLNFYCYTFSQYKVNYNIYRTIKIVLFSIHDNCNILNIRYYQYNKIKDVNRVNFFICTHRLCWILSRSKWILLRAWKISTTRSLYAIN